MPLSLHEGEPLADATTYRSIVGVVQYVSITRPDSSYVVNRVCQFMHKPTSLHWQVVKQSSAISRGPFVIAFSFLLHLALL